MKIRAGFVSNSSSTSFLIISKDDLNREDFLDLMGISADSPIVDLFDTFFDAVMNSIDTTADFSGANPDKPIADWFKGKYGRGLPEHMAERLETAKQNGLKAYYGLLSSESSMIECFFCTDSFEVENEKIYFNGLESAW